VLFRSAPRAAFQEAAYYKNAGLQKEAIAAFRRVLKKYPKSSESSAAHLELERLGVRIGGGVDTE
jgi:TolA-binding protein